MNQTIVKINRITLWKIKLCVLTILHLEMLIFWNSSNVQKKYKIREIKSKASRGLSGYRACQRVAYSRGPVLVAGLSPNK
jgi:hypothetical protein